MLTYLEMMQRFAAVAGLPKRRILPVPVLSPSLSSHWVNVVTPVPRGLARPLVESLKNTAVASEHDIAGYIPDPPEGLIGYERAVELALTKIQSLDVPTSWRRPRPRERRASRCRRDPDWAGGSLYVDERAREVQPDPSRCGGSSKGSAAAGLVLVLARLAGARLDRPAHRWTRSGPRSP